MIRRLFAATLLASALAATPAAAEPRTFTIDQEHFSIGFMARHLDLSNVIGMFLEGEGSFTYDADTQTVSDLRVEIVADSVFTNHKRRDRHLRSPDFLNAREFPTIVFTGTAAEALTDNTGTVTGDLELLGQTRPVTLDVTLVNAAVYPFGHEKFTLGISARTAFNRSQFGMSYGVGDLVGDEIELMLEFEAIQQ